MELKKVAEIATKIALKAFALLFFLMTFKVAAQYREYRQYLAKQRAANLERLAVRIGCGGSMGQRTNINQASAEELEELPGIGKVLARGIIRHRERHGLFKRPEDILIVRGMGEKKFRKLSPLICAE